MIFNRCVLYLKKPPKIQISHSNLEIKKGTDRIITFKGSHYIFIDLTIVTTLSINNEPCFINFKTGLTSCDNESAIYHYPSINIEYYNPIEMVNLSRFLSAIINLSLDDIESLKAEQVQQLNFDLITNAFGNASSNQFTKAEIITIFNYLQDLKAEFQKIVDSDIANIRNSILNT